MLRSRFPRQGETEENSISLQFTSPFFLATHRSRASSKDNELFKEVKELRRKLEQVRLELLEVRNQRNEDQKAMAAMAEELHRYQHAWRTSQELINQSAVSLPILSQYPLPIVSNHHHHHHYCFFAPVGESKRDGTSSDA